VSDPHSGRPLRGNEVLQALDDSFAGKSTSKYQKSPTVRGFAPNAADAVAVLRRNISTIPFDIRKRDIGDREYGYAVYSSAVLFWSLAHQLVGENNRIIASLPWHALRDEPAVASISVLDEIPILTLRGSQSCGNVCRMRCLGSACQHACQLLVLGGSSTVKPCLDGR
jgi:hypothetical protein